FDAFTFAVEEVLADRVAVCVFDDDLFVVGVKGERTALAGQAVDVLDDVAVFVVMETCVGEPVGVGIDRRIGGRRQSGDILREVRPVAVAVIAPILLCN